MKKITTRTAAFGLPFIAASLMAGMLSGCGTPNQQPSSETKAFAPDLRFRSAKVEMFVGSQPSFFVEYGETFKIPCSNGGWRARYIYMNKGNAGAAPHKNRSSTTGAGSYEFSQAFLAASATRTSYASFKKIPSPNVETPIVIELDATYGVAELYENNNRWYAIAIRACP